MTGYPMRFSPGIYEHAAALIGRTPWEVSRSSALLAEAHRTAWQQYRHPLVVTGIDVYNVEPEAYGAVVVEARGNSVPAITHHPCRSLGQMRNLPPLEPLQHQRIRTVLEAGRLLRDACTGAEVRIPVCGPFALAIGLIGLDELLVNLVEEPEELAAGLRHLLCGQFRFLEAIQAAGLRPIFFESGTTPPLLPVRDFIGFEAPLLGELFKRAQSLFGEPPPCIIGGDAAPVVKPLLAAGPGFVINPSETDQAAFMEAARAFPQIHVRVNLPASLLLSPSFDPIRTAAKTALALAATRPNSSVGCGVVPFETNPAMLLRLRSLVEAEPA